MKNLYCWIWLFCFLVGLAKCADSNYCSDLQAADGSRYNLQSLMENGDIVVPFHAGTFNYTLTLSLCSTNVDCGGATTGLCACRKNQESKCYVWWTFGAFNTSTVKPLNNGAGVEFQYEYNSPANNYYSKVLVLCDASNGNMTIQRSNASFVQVDGVTDGSIAYIYSRYACAINAPVTAPGDHGDWPFHLGTDVVTMIGSILLLTIVIGILLVVVLRKRGCKCCCSCKSTYEYVE